MQIYRFYTLFSLNRVNLPVSVCKWQNLTFFIEHKPSVKNIVPDYLSHYPVSDEGDNLVIPPPDVITFIISVYSLDVCDCTPDIVINTFYAPNVCLN